jgi:hypothetical protein
VKVELSAKLINTQCIKCSDVQKAFPMTYDNSLLNKMCHRFQPTVYRFTVPHDLTRENLFFSFLQGASLFSYLLSKKDYAGMKGLVSDKVCFDKLIAVKLQMFHKSFMT